MHSLLSLGDKPQAVQVATLLTVIGEDGREVYSTLRDWAQDGDDRRIIPVLRKFAEYCQPRNIVPFERYKFNKRTQVNRMNNRKRHCPSYRRRVSSTRSPQTKF